MQNHTKTALLLLAILGLAGCQSLGLSDPEKKVACPNYLILKNAAEITSGEPENPVWQVSIDRLAAECIAQGDQMTMRLGMKFLAERHKPGINIPNDARYFIAILDQDENIIGKESDSLSFEFKSENPIYSATIEQREISFAASGTDYTIYVGLEKPANQNKAVNQ